MKNINRFFKIYVKLFTSNLMQQMEYKADFILRGTFELTIVLSNYLFFLVIYQNVETIGGWTKEQSIILVLISALLDCVITLLFVGGLYQLPSLINEGKLDHIILKPINNRLLISLSNSTVSQLPNFIIEIILLIFCIIHYKIPITFKGIIYSVIVFVNAVIILYSIFFSIMCISFWSIKIDVGMKIFFQLYNIGNKPISVYPLIVQKIFTYIIPLAVAFNFPVLAITNSISLKKVVLSFIIMVIFYQISNLIFKFGLRKYVSASS
ncbi:ABC transporter permease [Treponema bryantii]|uniref:ABC transporter permease n=1 Tax=Treponema bryantii TaxID=163 RepID=UPI002B28F535|nr:multidrug ABC transporter permease [Treponema bryantii]